MIEMWSLQFGQSRPRLWMTLSLSWISWTKTKPDDDNSGFQMSIVWVMKLPSLSWPIRWESSALIFVGLICNYAMRLNISIAIIKVVKMNLYKVFLDEWEHHHSDVAVGKLFSNILGRWGSGFSPGCFLLRLCRLPGSPVLLRSSDFKNSGAWGANGWDVWNEESAWVQVRVKICVVCGWISFSRNTTF